MINLLLKYLIFALFLAIFIISPIEAAQKKKNDTQCDKNVFDTCTNRLLMVSDETFVFPVSFEKMNERCKEIKVLEKCTKDFATNCLRGDTKNSILVLMVSYLFCL